MKKSEVIFPDDPRAAKYIKNIEGWVSRHGIFYGPKGEAVARLAGSNASHCDLNPGEDCEFELPPEVLAAIETYNKAVGAVELDLWEPGEYRTRYDYRP